MISSFKINCNQTIVIDNNQASFQDFIIISTIQARARLSLFINPFKFQYLNIQMVLHFTNLPSHRRSILSLYRTLLRHARHLDQVTKFPDSNKLSVGSFVSNGIRSIFQKHKHWMSIINTESEIKKIYKV